MADESKPSIDSDGTNATAQRFAFLKGGDDTLKGENTKEFDWERSSTIVRDQLSEAMNAKNVAFLLGAGCSSYKESDKQVGIPTMMPLGREFSATVGKGRDKIFVNATERKISQIQWGWIWQLPRTLRILND